MSAATIQPAKCIAPQASNDLKTVRFVLNNVDAREVFVAGSFNDWNPGATPMACIGHGCWVKELSLPVGRYEYQFVVDGHWMQDRTAKRTVVNPFGGLNSVMVVRKPRARVAQTPPPSRKHELVMQP